MPLTPDQEQEIQALRSIGGSGSQAPSTSGSELDFVRGLGRGPEIDVPPVQPESFGAKVRADATELGRGLVASGKMLVTHPVELAKSIPGGVVEQAKQWRHPVEYVKQHPLLAGLDVVSVAIPGAVGVKAGRAAAAAGASGARAAMIGAGRAAAEAVGIPHGPKPVAPPPIAASEIPGRIGKLIEETRIGKVRSRSNDPLIQSFWNTVFKAKPDAREAIETQLRDVASVSRGRPAAAIYLVRTAIRDAMKLFPEDATVPNPRIEQAGPFSRVEIPLREAAMHYAEQGRGSRWAHVLTPEQADAIDRLVSIQNQAGNAARSVGVITGDIGKHRKILYGEESRHFSHRWAETPGGLEMSPTGLPTKSGLRGSTKQALQREIPTYEEGMRLGMTPERMDPFWNTERDIHDVVTAASGRNAINQLQRMEYTPGLKVLYYQKGAGHPPGYVSLDIAQNLKHPRRVWVHPDFANEVKGIVEYTSPASYEQNLQRLTETVKKVTLGASLFHWHALWEESVGGGQLPRFRKGLDQLWRGDERIVEGLKNGLQLEAGGVSPIEAARGLFGRVKGLNKVEAANDSALWDHYHQGLKSYAYLNVYDGLKRSNPGASAADIAKQAARMVNDQFGGLDWNRMLVDPRTQRMLRLLLLAPDWTASRVRIFAGSLPPEVQRLLYRTSQGVAKRAPVPGLRTAGRIAFEPMGGGLRNARRPYLNYWRNMAVYGAVGVNALNYLFTKQADGEGRYIWDNDKGHRDELRLPFNGPDGQKIYARVGKVITEPLHWAVDPGHTAYSKLHPFIGGAGTLMTGRDVWGRETVDPLASPGIQRAQRIAGVARAVLPIPARAGLSGLGRQNVGESVTTGLGFPTSRGYSKGQLVTDAAQAVLNQDHAGFQEAMRRARENGINPKALRGPIMQEVRRGMKGRARPGLEQVLEPQAR